MHVHSALYNNCAEKTEQFTAIYFLRLLPSFAFTACIFSYYSFSISFWTQLALQQILSSIDVFLSYRTDSTDSRTIYSAQRLDLFAWCVRLSQFLDGFRTHFESLHFHSIHSVIHSISLLKQRRSQKKKYHMALWRKEQGIRHLPFIWARSTPGTLRSISGWHFDASIFRQYVGWGGNQGPDKKHW